ncbi:reprolysin-like metallopeptidase [Secundilactobacillus muriivasis]
MKTTFWTTLTLTATLLFSVAAPIHAATSTPTATTLSQPASYYRTHATSLAQTYQLNYGAQTALTQNGKTKVYVASTDARLKKSAKLAMAYWNQRLGRQVFTTGTKGNHQLTIAFTNRNSTADAWWQPANRRILLERADYTQAPSQIKAKMINQSSAAAINAANQKIIKYSRSIANRANHAALYNHYRQQQINTINASVTKATNTINKNQLAYKARTFKYANIIAHELGHSLGLNHSDTATDGMAANSHVNTIYNYTKVKASANGFNPLTKADTSRAKLALKVFAARH